MLRAMIGTVAVLAGFAVLERSVDASTGQAGSCTPTQAYSLLPRGEVVPVRGEPTPQAAVIGTLSGRDGKELDAPGGDDHRQPERLGAHRARYGAGYAGPAGPRASYGWIPADLLTVDARVDGTITVYDRPGLLGRAVATIEGDDMKFRVLGCRGDLLQVINARHGNVWIDKWCAREDGCRS